MKLTVVLKVKVRPSYGDDLGLDEALIQEVQWDEMNGILTPYKQAFYNDLTTILKNCKLEYNAESPVLCFTLDDMGWDIGYCLVQVEVDSNTREATLIQAFDTETEVWVGKNDLDLDLFMDNLNKVLFSQG